MMKYRIDKYLLGICLIAAANFAVVYFMNLSIAHLKIFQSISLFFMMLFAYSSRETYISTKRILELEKKEAEKSADEFKHILRTLSHDLGTSMTVIDVSSQILKSSVQVEDEKKQLVLETNLGRITKSLEIQSKLLESARTQDALESGKLNIELGPVNLLEVTQNVEQNFKSRLKEKFIKMVYDEKELNINVIAEQLSLTTSVMANFISNAIKFAHSYSEITIKCSVKGDKVELQVCDEGLGIKKEDLPNLFDPNISTNKSGTLGEIGTGFGMPLAKNYLEKYGATVELESTPHAGTTVTMVFKLADQSELKEAS